MKFKKTKTLLTLFIAVCICACALSVTIAQTCIDTYAASKKYDAKKAKKNLKYTYKKIPEGIMVLCKNNNSFDVKLDGTVKFKDAANHTLSTEKDSLETVSAKKTAILYFKAPLDANGDIMKYAKYSKSIKVSKPSKTSYSGQIQCSTNTLATGFNLSVYNNSPKNLDIIRVSCVIYDAKKNIVGYTKKYVTCYEKNTSVLETVAYPSHCQNPDSVKCYVDTAYKY